MKTIHEIDIEISRIQHLERLERLNRLQHLESLQRLKNMRGNMNYGLPYQGSKSKVCEWLFTHIPKTDTFYDVFAGGGAVTDYAIRHKWFQKYYVNDINSLMSKALQMYFTNGFANECRWISREEFFKLKDTDPYVAICFSFGNDLRSYAYAEDVEPIKKAFHYAICFDDYSMLDEYLGEYKIRLKESSIFDRRIELQRYLTKLYRKSLISGKYGVNEQHLSPNLTNLDRLQELYKGTCTNGDNVRAIAQNLQAVEKLNRLQSLKDGLKLSTDKSNYVHKLARNINCLNRLERESNITFTNSNYLDLEFEPNCIIYCDPPYKDTKDYDQNFTHEQFYDWCRNQKELTLISEYNMPDDFIKISEIKTKSSMSATATVDALERLYIPKHQKDLYYEKFHEDDW